jgi:GcrA cell cycle regulator
VSNRAASPERVAELKRLMAEGLSWREIGRRLGCSKHAVSGLVRRHVYGKKHNYKNPALVGVERKPGKRAAARIKRAALVLVPAPPPVITPVDVCQWPLGRGRPWRFCEAPIEPGLPYCSEHCRQAYVHQVAA